MPIRGIPPCLSKGGPPPLSVLRPLEWLYASAQSAVVTGLGLRKNTWLHTWSLRQRETLIIISFLHKSCFCQAAGSLSLKTTRSAGTWDCMCPACGRVWLCLAFDTLLWSPPRVFTRCDCCQLYSCLVKISPWHSFSPNHYPPPSPLSFLSFLSSLCSPQESRTACELQATISDFKIFKHLTDQISKRR